MHHRESVASDSSPMKDVREAVNNGDHHQEIVAGMHLS